MSQSNFIYSLSNQLNTLNPNLAKEVNIISIGTLAATIAQAKVKVILFEERHIPRVLKVINSEDAEAIRFVCIGYELNSSDRLTLLNHNVEFITVGAYTQLNLSYFEQSPNTDSDSYKVLIVEDDENQIMLTQHILINAKIVVESVKNGNEVLAALASFKPNLILMDLYLEGINGDEVVKIIRKKQAYESLPVVFLTSDATIETRMRILNAGADDVLTKPINAELLVSALFNRMKIASQPILPSQLVEPSAELNKADIEDKISHFFKKNIENKSASIIWLKIDNVQLLQKDLGFIEFKNLCAFFFNKIASFYKDYSAIQQLADGVYAIAFENQSVKQCQHMVKEIQDWLQGNHFSINNQDYIINVFAIILSDIPAKTNKDLLIQSAEITLIEKQTLVGSMILRGQKSEEIQFDKIKNILETSIKTRNFKWAYLPIYSTQTNDKKIFQLDIIVISNSGNEVYSDDYLDIAYKTGMLKVLNKFSFEHAIRIVRSREQDTKDTIVLVKQQLSDYKSLKANNSLLDVVKNLNLPYGAIMFDFSLNEAREHLDQLSSIGRDLKLANIKICISDFVASSLAWEVARKLKTKWIKLKKFDKKSKLMDVDAPNNLSSVVNKANILCYEVMVTDISDEKFATKLKGLNIHYIQYKPKYSKSHVVE